MKLQLDKVRELKYGMRGLSKIEKYFGKPVNKINFDDLTMEEAAVVLHAGLSHEDPQITPDTVMDYVDQYSSLHIVLKTMGAALREAWGEEPQQDTEDDKQGQEEGEDQGK